MATAFFLFCYTVFSELVRRKDNNKKHEEVAQYVLSAVDIETATLNKHNVCEYFGMSLQHSRNGATPAVTNVILQSGKSLLFVTSENPTQLKNYFYDITKLSFHGICQALGFMLLIKHKLALMNMHFYTLDGFFRVYKSSFLQYSSAILQHTAIKQGAVMFCAPEHALQLHTVLPGLVVQVSPDFLKASYVPMLRMPTIPQDCQPICNMATLLAEGILAEKQGDGSMLRVIRTTIDTFTKCNIAQLAKIKGMIMMWDEVVASMASADDSWLHSIKSSLLKQGQQHKSTDDDTQMLQDIFMSMGGGEGSEVNGHDSIDLDRVDFTLANVLGF